MKFKRGYHVSKTSGDYYFDGIVIAVFTKLSGVTRLAVEDKHGVVHIYSEKNLRLNHKPFRPTRWNKPKLTLA